MKATEVTAYGFFALAMVLLGRYELRTDDSGMVAFFILLIAFTLAWLQPKQRLLWCLSGWCVPLAEMFRGENLKGLPDLKSKVLLFLFVTLLGIVGSSAGVFLKRRTN